MPERIRCKQALHRPPGYRVLGDLLAESKTGKAMRFRYYSWVLWIPRHALVQTKDGEFTCPAWAVHTAKEHESSLQGQAAYEFAYQAHLKRGGAPEDFKER